MFEMQKAAAIENEKELLARCIEGDAESFIPILEKYQNRIYNFIRFMIRNDEAAKDLAQEAFEKAFAALMSFRLGSEFSPWIFRIAYNLCRDYYKSKKRGETSLEAEPEDGESEWHGKTKGAAEEFEIKEMRNVLDTALNALKPMFRDALLLKHYEGFSYEEISEILGVSENAARLRVLHARQQMQELMKGYKNGF